MVSCRLSKSNGFTLIEVIITLVIVGVLSSLALPRLTFVLEKMRFAEGLQILEALRNAQTAYEAENPGNYADNLIDLDVTIPAPDNFNDLDNTSVANNAANVAQVTRSTGDYTLRIEANGTIHCAETAAGICAKLGCSGGGGDECN